MCLFFPAWNTRSISSSVNIAELQSKCVYVRNQSQFSICSHRDQQVGTSGAGKKKKIENNFRAYISVSFWKLRTKENELTSDNSEYLNRFLSVLSGVIKYDLILWPRNNNNNNKNTWITRNRNKRTKQAIDSWRIFWSCITYNFNLFEIALWSVKL